MQIIKIQQDMLVVKQDSFGSCFAAQAKEGVDVLIR
jgi:hypothetical protein